MRLKILAFTAAIALAVPTTGCDTIASAFGASNVVKGGYTVAKAALLVYRDGYQSAVLDYGHLPLCNGTVHICRSAAIWQKLKAIDAAATPTIVAADLAMRTGNGDFSSISAMMGAVAEAETKIAALGIAPKTQ